MSSRDVHIRLDLAAALPVRRALFGANCERTNLPHDCLDYDDETFIRFVKQIGSPMARYPGGTLSNYLNPVTGFMDSVQGGLRDHTAENDKIQDQTNGNGLHSESFFRMVNSTHSDYTIVLNVHTCGVEENRMFLRKIKAQGHLPKYFELGNEVYYKEYQHTLPNVKAYIQIAAALSRIIRRLFPDARIGVPIPNHIYGRKERYTASTYMNAWVRALAARPEIFDAVVMHCYSENGSLPGEGLPSYETAALTSISHADNHLDQTIDSIRELFGDTKIWVTEYGMAEFEQGPMRAKFQANRTFAGALHNDVFLMKLMTRPQVEIAHWHSLSKFTDIGGRRGRGKHTETMAAKHFGMLLKSVLGATSVVPLQIRGVDSHDSFSRGHPGRQDDLEAVFVADDDITGSLLIVNKVGTPYRLRTVTAVYSDGTETAFDLCDYTRLGIKEGVDPKESLGSRCECAQDACAVDLGGSVMLTRFSLTKIRLSREML